MFFVAGTAGAYYLFQSQEADSGTVHVQLAQAARDELLNEFKGKILPPNHPVTRHVRRVLTRLLDGSDLGTLRDAAQPRSQREDAGDVWNPDREMGRTEEVAPGVGGRQWELIVVNDDKVVNAAASYGNVVVFTGILPVAKDEEGLAAVLGHEIGHVVARHNSERYSNMKALVFITYLLDYIGLDVGIGRLITTLMMDLPNSRKLEYEECLRVLPNCRGVLASISCTHIPLRINEYSNCKRCSRQPTQCEQLARHVVE
ncbi:hypothetical protein EUX98_g1525 [Antrodiella citrinella]|uniref:Peptidase M48 domain-containing protein n=1 Tax=Antrodiella citrinella TaxID=2447956 RepID=A0A4S4N196_9APHY|nr:hypothetical protein EUX98_g1525 [Antrodiella citrinella]